MPERYDVVVFELELHFAYSALKTPDALCSVNKVDTR